MVLTRVGLREFRYTLDQKLNTNIPTTLSGKIPNRFTDWDLMCLLRTVGSINRTMLYAPTSVYGFMC